MYAKLSKKSEISDKIGIKCLVSSREHDFIACGGEDGLLKVLKLESEDIVENGVKNLDTFTKLSMNETLEGHSGTVEYICWNEPFKKLTSGDTNGLIVVWELYQDCWYEEMVNNRNKSRICGMNWSFDGQKLCVIYSDGAVILGSVDGNRIWSKELKEMRLSVVEWSPDGRLLLFGVIGSGVHVYHQNGKFLTKISVNQGINAKQFGNGCVDHVVAIKWFKSLNVQKASESPTLAIAYGSGRIQVMKNELERKPIVFDAELRVSNICWNTGATILVVTGCMDSQTDGKQNVLKFFNTSGDLVQTLPVPGSEVYSSSWVRDGMSIALAVDSYLYFADVSPDTKGANDSEDKNL